MNKLNNCELLEQELRREDNKSIHSGINILTNLRDKAISNNKLGDAQSYGRKIDQLNSRLKNTKI